MLKTTLYIEKTNKKKKTYRHVYRISSKEVRVDGLAGKLIGRRGHACKVRGVVATVGEKGEKIV